MTDLPDTELVEQARQGRAEAYEELVARYQGHVYALAYSLVGNWADAQDITQDAFIRAYANLDQLQEADRFAAWLRRVTFSVTMNWLRSFRPRAFEQLDGRVDLDVLEIPDFAPGPPEVVERRELARVVMAAVAGLPPKYRVPLTMFHLDGLSYQKVAQFLDIPLGTAKALIHRARAKLKSALASYITEEVAPMVQEVFDGHRLPAGFARRVVDNVPRLAWGQGRDISWMSALVAVANTLGDKVTYDWLMGVSGAAFKVQLCQPDWCPSAPEPGLGFDASAVAAQALGYTLETMFAPAADPAAVDRVRVEIVGSLDQGLPVLAIDLIRSADWGIIAGYADGGKTLLCRTYWDDAAADYVPAERWPWLTTFIRARGPRPDRKRLLRESLQHALTTARTAEYPAPMGPNRYLSGFHAYETWAEQLGETARFQGKLRGQYMQANAWCYSCLMDARRAAVRYLREIAPELPPAESSLRQAADLYAQVVQVLEAGRPAVAFPWLPDGRRWNPARRLAQAEVLREALALERQAVAHIEDALKAVG